MADALISFLIEQLGSSALEKIKEKVKLVSEVEKSVKNFASNLQTIQLVLKDAEKNQLKKDVQHWLDKLKEVSYEMDDVLDGWNTEIQKQEVEKQEKENALVQVCFSIPSSSNCFCFGEVSRRIVVRQDIAQAINQLNIRLTSIAEERQRYKFHPTTASGTEQPAQRSKTASLVDVSEIFGRVNEKHDLINKLLGDSTSTSTSTGEEERGPLVISVVGMGGMGKTALAKVAYNDEKVKAHFEKSRWVCVSYPFDEIKIARAIIGNDDIPISDELDALLKSVSKSVKGKKFLLVLDDVWTEEDDTKWEQLKLALMVGAKGSRILMTTRNKMVARRMEATPHIIHLGKLSDQDCLSLFFHFVFPNREEDKIEFFKDIGNKIVKKCNGCPLAAKTLGSLLRLKNTPEKWHEVLESEMWEIEDIEQKVFSSLLLSYYELTSEIKRCLLFCAIFPKNYKIDKNNLIELWMSQNYLSSKKNKEERTLGQEYIDDLVMRSFFEDFENDSNGNLKHCKMHEIVHDFVKFLTRNEYFIIEANGANQARVCSSDSVHHLTLMLERAQLSLPTPFHTCKKLRSLTTFKKGLTISNMESTTIDWELILQLKCLRALNLSKSNVEVLPKEIGQLLHLRYIDLSYNIFLKELPDAMCNLCNLETLHLEWCESLEKLPKAMGKLINLKHLYVEHTHISCLPKGLGRLTGLRILDKYTVVYGGDDDNEILKLGDLGRFEQLQGIRKLEIVGLGIVKDVSEAQKAQLVNLKHLLELTMDFGVSKSQEQQRISDEEVLNVLSSHQDLKYLSVGNYQGATLVFRNWVMSLQHLTRLTLRKFEYCESLPPLGKLPYLEVLSIDSMPMVEKVEVKFLGIEETPTSPAFPKLKELSFSKMGGWKEWEGVGYNCEVSIMPYLSRLSILDAPNLKQLPDFVQNRPLYLTRENSPLLLEQTHPVSSVSWQKELGSIPQMREELCH